MIFVKYDGISGKQITCHELCGVAIKKRQHRCISGEGVSMNISSVEHAYRVAVKPTHIDKI